jgi:hypothetical protein
MGRRRGALLIIAGATALIATFSQVTVVAAAAPQGQDCGPYPAASADHVINASPVISCSQAVDVLTQLFNNPAIQRGDGGAQVADWTCNVYGSAKAETLGYVARCDNSTGSVLLTAAAA